MSVDEPVDVTRWVDDAARVMTAGELRELARRALAFARSVDDATLEGPAKLTAAQAVEALPRTATPAQLVDALGMLGLPFEVALAATEATLTPKRVDVSVVLLAEQYAPTLTLSIRVER